VYHNKGILVKNCQGEADSLWQLEFFEEICLQVYELYSG